METRHLLPVYKDSKYAKLIFDEFNGLQTQYKSYIEWQRKPYNGITVHIDENGQRYDPKRLNIRGQKQVYFFGGSTMWGTGVDDANTIPTLFKKTTNFNSYNVYNLGESGYDSRQTLEALINLLNTGTQIDIAVFYFGVNEINLCRKAISINSHIYENTFNEKIRTEISYPKYLFFGNIELLWSFFFKKNNNSSDDYDFECDCNSVKLEKIINSISNNLSIMKYLVEKNGGQFYAILQPVLYFRNPEKSHLRNYLNNVNKKEELNFKILFKSILKEKQGEIPYLYDFTKIFDNKRYIYIDFCHVGNEGNLIVAKKIDSLLASKNY
ncbi:hypothetical protein [Lacihabitans sp. CS3-21]|uniref:SGNH/GDSL hydrolase family protein n=1 Tax=Lacihabitans sp. CS3-21 TaxID=2487332 RepID=UPI0020CD0361|nr:hypothetical protein [Lacihabitans sp. CS3-21]